MEIVTAALGLLVGLGVGYGTGRRAERAAQAWEATRASFLVARSLTGQAAGYMLGGAALVALAVLALVVSR